MKTLLKLSVNNPCNENFESFKKTTSGGFCDSCSKEVIDFSTMSDQELIKFFDGSNKNYCGKLKSDQLKTYNTKNYNAQRKSNRIISVFGLSLAALLLTTPILGQEKMPKIEVVSTSEIKKESVIKQISKKELEIKGVVSDKIGALPGASILLKGTITGIDSDVDGKFTFPKLLKPGDILIFSYLGYETIEVKIKENTSFLKIVMIEGEIGILGAVSVEKIHKSKKSLWQRIKSLF